MPPAASIPELDNTGSPAMGWITDLRKVKGPCLWCEQSGLLKLTDRSITCPACNGQKDRVVLQADFADVHPSLANAIDKKSYRRVSAEVYDDAKQAGLNGTGRALRRVAFVGGEIPKIKTLADLPSPGPNRELKNVEIFCAGQHRGKDYSEPRIDEIIKNFNDFSRGEKSLLRAPAVVGHEESQPLSRFSESALDALIAKTKGADDGSIFTTDIRIAGEAVCEIFSERLPAAKIPTPKESAMTRDQLLATLTAAPYSIDPAKLKDQPDAVLQLFVETMPKPTPAPTPAPIAQPFDVAKFTETVKTSLLAELKPAIMADVKTMVDKDIGAARGQVDQFTENLRRDNVATFCEQMVKEGKVQPWELDKTNPKVMPLDEQLLLADHKIGVRKFTENGQEVTLTQFDLITNSIKARKPMKFGEKIPSPNGPAANPDEEIGKVEKFYDDHKADLQKFSFIKKEDFIEVYKKSTPEQQKQLLEMAA